MCVCSSLYVVCLLNQKSQNQRSQRAIAARRRRRKPGYVFACVMFYAVGIRRFDAVGVRTFDAVGVRTPADVAANPGTFLLMLCFMQ
jgi:hypothetical protein